MPTGRRVSEETQLAIARHVLQGTTLAKIGKELKVHASTVKTYRQRLLVGLKASGIELECGCGNVVGHRGHCSAGRMLPDDAPELSDRQLLAAFNGKVVPARSEEDSKREFARMVGRSRGWGESDASIRRRLKIGRLELEALKRDYVTDYNAGVEEGRKRLIRAQNQQAHAPPSKPMERHVPAGTNPKKPDASGNIPTKPEESRPAPTDPDGSDAIASDQPAPATSSFEPSDDGEKPEVATDRERRVAMLLGDAWDEFLKLERHGVHDIEEFHRAVHQAQSIIGMRVARRVDPEFWRQA